MSKIKRWRARARGYSGGGSVGPAPKSNRLVGEFRDPGEHAGGRRFLAPDDFSSRDLDARRQRNPHEPYPARGRARAALADGGSVLDDLRESLEMQAASVHSPEERAANRATNVETVLGALPVTGNILSAVDVPQSAPDDLFSMAKVKKPVKKYANGGRIKGALSRARVVTGGVRGKTGGREDALPVDVPDGAYVVPADIVAALGDGNSEAGMHRLEKMYGLPRRANGGRVPIMISHGEFVLTPEAVDRAGGADMLDAKVTSLRNAWARHLQELEGPNK